MKKTVAALLVAFAASSAVPAVAAEQAAQPKMTHHHHHHKGASSHREMMAQSAVPMNKLPASTRDFIKSNEKMHREMMIDYTGNADIDFVRGMVAHHKGAIGMAEVELKYGKDAEMRALAKQIIATQKTEIRQMDTWLKHKRRAAEEQAKADRAAAKEQAKMQAKTAYK